VLNQVRGHFIVGHHVPGFDAYVFLQPLVYGLADALADLVVIHAAAGNVSTCTYDARDFHDRHYPHLLRLGTGCRYGQLAHQSWLRKAKKSEENRRNWKKEKESQTD
jgi:hypothetical protein